MSIFHHAGDLQGLIVLANLRMLEGYLSQCIGSEKDIAYHCGDLQGLGVLTDLQVSEDELLQDLSLARAIRYHFRDLQGLEVLTNLYILVFYQSKQLMGAANRWFL